MEVGMIESIDEVRRAFAQSPAESRAFVRYVEALRREQLLEEVVEAYRQRATAVGGDEAYGLYLTLADLWGPRLGMPGLTSEALFAAYQLRPSAVLLADRLRRHLEQQNDWSLLARLMDSQARQATDPAQAQLLWLRFGHFLRQRLHDLDEAARVYAKAGECGAVSPLPALVALRRLYRTEPSCSEAARLVLRLGKPPGALEQEIARLQQELSKCGHDDRQGRAAILLALARLSLEQVGDGVRALELLKRARELSPSVSDDAYELLWALVLAIPEHTEAQGYLRQMAVELGRWEDALRLARLGVEKEASPADQARLLMQMAMWEACERHDETAAAALLDEAFLTCPESAFGEGEVLSWASALVPRAPALRASLLRLLEGTGAFDELERLWGQMVEAAPSELARGEALWTLARLQAERAKVPRQALAAFMDAAHALPREAILRLMEDLVDLYDVLELREEVVDAVLALALRVDSWEVAADLLAQHAASLLNPQRRARRYLELATILGKHLNLPEGEAKALEQARRAAPDEPMRLGQGDHLLDGMTEDGPHRGEAADLARSDKEAEARATMLVTRLRTTADALLLDASGGQEAEQKRALLAEAALQQLLRAEGPFRRRLLETLQARHFLVLAQFAQRDEAHHGTAALLNYLAYLQDPDRIDDVEALSSSLERGDFLLELGWVLHGEVRRARAGTQRQDACERLQEAARRFASDLPLALLADFAALEGAPQREDYEDLLNRCRAAGEWNILLEVLMWAADGAPWLQREGASAQVAVLREASQVAGAGLLDTERQVAILRRLLGVDPNDEETLQFFRTHFHDDPLALYQLLAPAVLAAQGSQERVQRQAELAQLSQVGMGDLDRARFHWHQVLASDEVSEPCLQRAIQAMQQIYGGCGQIAELVKHLEARIEVQPEGPRRLMLLNALVTTLRENDYAPAEVRRALTRMLEIAPDDGRALAGLVELEIDAGDYLAAVERLDHLAASTEGDARLRHRLRQAALYTDGLGQWPEALAILVDLSWRYPEEAAIRQMLGQVLSAEGGEHLEAARCDELLRLVLEHPAAPEEKQKLLLMAAEVLGSDHHAAEQVVTLWQELSLLGPQDVESAVGLGRSFEELGHWDRAIDCYQGALVRQDLKAAQRAALYSLLGDACLHGQSDPKQALVAFREASRLQPDNVDYVRAVLTCANVLEDPEIQRDALVRLFELANDAAERFRCGLSLIRLDVASGRVAEACHWVMAMRGIGGQPGAQWNKVIDALRPVVDAEPLVQVLGVVAEQIEEEALRVALSLEQARLLEYELQQEEAAIAVHARLLERQPWLIESLEALARLHYVRGDGSAALTALETLIRLSPERRVEPLLASGTVLSEILNDPAQAFARFRWAHELAPSDPRPLEGMWHLAELNALWAELIDVLEQDAMRADVPEVQVEGLMQVSHLAEEKLGDLDRAFHVARMAQQIAPHNRQVLREIERLAVRGGSWLELAVVYRSLADWAEREEEQIDFLHRVAEVTEHRLGDPEGAMDVLFEVLDEYPHDADTQAKLQQLADTHALWALVLDYYDTSASRTANAQTRLERILQAADVCETRLGRSDWAVERLLKGLVMSPLDAGIVKRLAAQDTVEQAVWDSVAKIMAEAEVPASERLTMKQALATIHAERRQQPSAGLDVLLSALAEDPLHPDIFDQAVALAERTRRYPDLLRVFERKLVDTLDRHVALALMQRKAEVCELAGDEARTLEAMRQILTVDPAHPFVVQRLAKVNDAGMTPQHRLLVLEVQAEKLADPLERAEKRVEAAEVLLAMGRLSDAAEALERALREDAHHVRARRMALDLYARLGRWPLVRDGLRWIIDNDAEPQHLRDDLLTFARVCEEELKQVDGAASALRYALDLWPEDDAILVFLEGVLERNGKWAELMAHFEVRAGQADGYEERKRCLLGVARIAMEVFKNKPKALAAVEEIYGDGGERDAEVLVQLADLYEGMGRWDRTAEALQILAELQPAAEMRAEVLWRLAEIREQRLSDADAALDVFSDLVQSSPKDAGVWLRQAKLQQEKGDWQGAQRSLQEAAAVQPAAEAADTWFRIGVVRRDTGGDVQGALSAFEQAVSLDARHRQAFAALLSWAQARGDHERLLTLYELALGMDEGPDAQAALLWRRALLRRDAFAEPAAAEADLRAALALRPGHWGCRRDLADVLFVAERWGEAAALYHALTHEAPPLAESEKDDYPEARLGRYESDREPDRFHFQFRLAHCLEQQESYRHAATLYSALAELYPDHSGVLLGLSHCHYKLGNWSAARRHIEKVLDGTHPLEAQDLARTSYFWGDILHGSDRLDEARQCFERSLDADPSYRPAADQRLAILIKQKRWGETIPAFQKLLALTDDAEVRGAIHKRIGEVYEYFLDRVDDAIVAYEQAVLLGGDVFDVPERLLRLYAQTEQWEKGRLVASALLEEQREGSAGQIEYMLVLGDILFKGLGEADEAQEMYQAAFTKDPSNLQALERLGRLLGMGKNLEGMSSLYESYLRALPEGDSEARAAALLAYADQLVQLCGADADAVAVLMRVQAFFPNDLRVHRRLVRVYAPDHLALPELEVQHLRKVVDLKGFQRHDIERIGAIYEAVAEHEGRDAVAGLLRFIDGNDEAPLPWTRLAPGVLQGDAYQRHVVHPFALGPLGDVFALLAELGRDFFSQEVVGDVEEIGHQTRSPAVAIFNELTKAMNLTPRRLYVDKDSGGVPYRVVMTDPPSVVIARDTLRSLLGHELRFFLARALELSRPRFLLPSALSAFELVTLVRTLLSELSTAPPASVKLSLVERRTQERVQRFLRELKARHSLEVQENLVFLIDEVLRQNGGEAPSAKRYVAAARVTAIRCGLLASQSQVATLKRVLKEMQGTALYRPRSFQDFHELVGANADLHALLSYLVSDHYVLAQRAICRTTAKDVLPPRAPVAPSETDSLSLDDLFAAVQSKVVPPDSQDPVLDGLEGAATDKKSTVPAMAGKPSPVAAEAALATSGRQRWHFPSSLKAMPPPPAQEEAMAEVTTVSVDDVSSVAVLEGEEEQVLSGEEMALWTLELDDVDLEDVVFDQAPPPLPKK